MQHLIVVWKHCLKNKTMFTLLCKIVEERIFLHKHCAGNRILQFWTNSVKCIYNAVNLCFRKYFSYTEMLNRSMCIMKCLIGLKFYTIWREIYLDLLIILNPLYSFPDLQVHIIISLMSCPKYELYCKMTISKWINIQKCAFIVFILRDIEETWLWGF